MLGVVVLMSEELLFAIETEFEVGELIEGSFACSNKVWIVVPLWLDKLFAGDDWGGDFTEALFAAAEVVGVDGVGLGVGSRALTGELEFIVNIEYRLPKKILLSVP
uniref:Uncharacterized protein n=1 Tax=Cacopsylla melanoneura TaxID=428564 RepID=A0A8D8LYT6_9HEMI